MPLKKLSDRRKILLVEDDDSMRRFLEIVLQRAGYEVLLAEDGLEAMEAMLTTDFDAVVSDAVMPNLSGHDLCRILRQNLQMKHLPFVILSGLEQDDSAIAQECRANAYLLKGSNLGEELIKKLSKFFNKTN